MRVRRVVTSFIEHSGKILILRRSGRVGSYQGKWAGVSGYLEEGEDGLTRALKEVEEEIGLKPEQLKLLREGEPLHAYDKALDHLWIIHPYLFATNSTKIRLDWEHVEHRWVEPEDLYDYPTVPRLVDTLSRVKKIRRYELSDQELINLIKKIEEDKVHGASWLGEEAIKVFRAALKRFRGDVKKDFIEYMKMVGKMLIEARPSMATLSNNVGSMLATLLLHDEKLEKVEELKAAMLRACDELLKERRRAFDKVIEEGAKLLPKDGSVLTMSYSSTTLNVLKRAFKDGKKIKVWVAESRPLLEGRRLAEELAKSGLATTLITDAAIGHFMSSVDVVMVGADSILYDGSVVNKVGTYLLALAAKEMGVPFYAVCEGQKLDTLSYIKKGISLEEKDPSEVHKVELPSLTVRNPYFDVTPSKLVTAIITEEGPVHPGEVEAKVLKMLTELYFP